ENLYFSGPAGPALSYNFQLVVTNSAVGAGTETTRTMHENSAQHAETLTTLTQQCGEAFQFIATQRETPAY
ncbi:MAG: hypothetical protein K2Z81_27465, partial [Cyanobacteria bacterium]|nr:hypothetical protein [Cyanobacteriota bacterium]